MEYEKRQALKATARRVAASLMTELKAGKLRAIGIDAIEQALLLEPDCPRNANDFDTLSEMTTRCVVERVG